MAFVRRGVPERSQAVEKMRELLAPAKVQPSSSEGIPVTVSQRRFFMVPTMEWSGLGCSHVGHRFVLHWSAGRGSLATVCCTGCGQVLIENQGGIGLSWDALEV